MSKDFLFVNGDNFQEEATAFEESDFINSSAGVADAGKPIVLDASGKLDSSFLDASVFDHGSLSGLGDDDHTIYSLVDGTRAYTGIVQYNVHPTFVNDTDIIDKKYADDLFNGTEWQDSAIDRLIAPPVSPTTGDRYLIDAVLGTATGAWAGQEDKIAQWNGSAWDFTAPTTGMKISVDDENDGHYFYGGSAWSKQFYENTTASTGLVKVGTDIRLDASSAGDGLGFTAGVLNVNVDDSSIETNSDTLRVKALGITNAMLAGSIDDSKLLQDYIQTSEVDDVSIEWTGTQLQVKADGINDLMIDWGIGANQVSAVDMPIADAGGFTSETDVEGAIQELFGLNNTRGVVYVAGASGVSKGDLVYVSANDTASTHSTLANAEFGIGLASATAGVGVSFTALADDQVLTGVLSAATAGDKYYWDGSSIVSSAPTGGGSHVWRVGTAKNATDLHVDVEFVKKNK